MQQKMPCSTVIETKSEDFYHISARKIYFSVNGERTLKIVCQHKLNIKKRELKLEQKGMFMVPNDCMIMGEKKLLLLGGHNGKQIQGENFLKNVNITKLKTDITQNIFPIVPNNRTFSIDKIHYTSPTANNWLISLVIIGGMTILSMSLTVIAVVIIRKPQYTRQQLELSTYVPGFNLKPTYTF